MGWASAISAFLTLLSMVLEMYIKARPQAARDQRNDAINTGRKEIAEGDVAAVNARIDRVLSEGKATSNNPIQQHSDTSTAERVRAILDS